MKNVNSFQLYMEHLQKLTKCQVKKEISNFQQISIIQTISSNP